MNKHKSTRGGARVGAGNKKGVRLKAETRKQRQFRATDAEWERLEKLAPRNRSRYIRMALGIDDSLFTNAAAKPPLNKLC